MATRCASCENAVGRKSWLFCPEHWQNLPQYHKTELETTRLAYEQSLEDELPEANQRNAFVAHQHAVNETILFFE